MLDLESWPSELQWLFEKMEPYEHKLYTRTEMQSGHIRQRLRVGPTTQYTTTVELNARQYAVLRNISQFSIATVPWKEGEQVIMLAMTNEERQTPYLVSQIFEVGSNDGRYTVRVDIKVRGPVPK